MIFNELCFLREERNKNCDERDNSLKIQKIFSRVPALSRTVTELDLPKEKYKINEENYKIQKRREMQRYVPLTETEHGIEED